VSEVTGPAIDPFGRNGIWVNARRKQLDRGVQIWGIISLTSTLFESILRIKELVMSILSEPHFHNEAAAIARLEAIVWPKGPYCPRCGGFDRITLVNGARVGLRRCGPCKREFTVTVGTIFERSHVKLHKWFQVAHLMTSSKKGISAHQIHRTLKLTYKTAWFMCHRLREAMRDGHFTTQLGGEGNAVEIDETFVGGLEKNKHRNKRQHLGTGGAGKESVFSLVERGGRVRSHHVQAVTAKNLRPIVEAQIHGATYVMTDEGGPLRKLAANSLGTAPSITALESMSEMMCIRTRLRAISPF
jgi:transposase-like protein